MKDKIKGVSVNMIDYQWNNTSKNFTIGRIYFNRVNADGVSRCSSSANITPRNTVRIFEAQRLFLVKLAEKLEKMKS